MIVIALAAAACGGASATATSAPTLAPTSAPTNAPAANTPLQEIAALKRGGPGAIYVGNLEDLVGPIGEGAEENVSLSDVQKKAWIFESTYYKNLLERAAFTDPTELVTSGETFELDYTCFVPSFPECVLAATSMASQVLERTEGQVQLTVSSYADKRLGGPENLALVSDGTLDLVEMFRFHAASELPLLDIQNLWGLYPDQETEFEVITTVMPDFDRLISEATGGRVVFHNWFPGDHFLFTKEPIRSLEDLKGLRARSQGVAMSDWLEGMGAQGQFVGLPEVYSAVQRGILDVAISGIGPAVQFGWLEVTEYISGPLISIFSTDTVINSDLWESLPADIQQILLEEGAKLELETLRLVPWVDKFGQVEINPASAGQEYILFSPEMRAHEFNVALLQNVLPRWIERAGGADSDAVRIFNEKVSPIVGVIINPDGTASKIGE